MVYTICVSKNIAYKKVNGEKIKERKEMIGYHYNKEKGVIVAFFCEDESGRFEGRRYWFRHITKSIWKVFNNS